MMNMLYLSKFINTAQITFYLFITKYFTFRGRSNRTEYISLVILINGLDYIIPLFLRLFYKNNSLIIASIITSVILYFPSLAVTVRRFHDFDKSGWGGLLIDVSLLLGFGFLFSYNHPISLKYGVFLTWAIWGYTIVLGLIEGTPGPNRFGNEPEY